MDCLVVSSSQTVNGEFVSKKIVSSKKERQTCPLISDLFHIPPRMTGTGKGVGGLTYLWPFQSWGCAGDGDERFLRKTSQGTGRGGAALLCGGEPLSRRQLPGPAPAAADTVAPCFGFFFGPEIINTSKGRSDACKIILRPSDET